MSIVGGLDIHRKQLTFDYVDTATGELSRGKITPADRQYLAVWLRRFDGAADVAFAVEGCTGWRYVVQELHAAGVEAHLAEPADTAAARGRKKRAKTGLMRSYCVSCSTVAEIERLLAGCDRERPVGRRDYAVLSLLARLGLRGAEAAGPQLDDIDWRAGEIAVCGKGCRVERLPLPAPAGEALAAWLSGGRPRCEPRAVFVTMRRPYRQLMTPEAVRAIMGRACDRAGLERRGAHRLRHALATEMLRAGAPLPEVGQVLRHRSHQSALGNPLVGRREPALLDHAGLQPLADPSPCASPG
jgi:hypothetical protein